jgi:hypothetical protein
MKRPILSFRNEKKATPYRDALLDVGVATCRLRLTVGSCRLVTWDYLFVEIPPRTWKQGSAGVRTCGARYGYGDVSEIAKWAPGYWTDDLRELV